MQNFKIARFSRQFSSLVWSDIVRKIENSVKTRGDNLSPVTKLNLKENQILQEQLKLEPDLLFDDLNTRVKYVKTAID